MQKFEFRRKIFQDADECKVLLLHYVLHVHLWMLLLWSYHTIIHWTSMTSTGTFLTKRRMHLLRWKHKKKYLFQCKIYALPILFTNLCCSEHKGPLSLAAVTSFNKSWLTCHYTLSSYLKFRLNGGMSNYNSKGPVS